MTATNARSGRGSRAVAIVTVLAALACMAAVVVWKAPANWLALQLADRTRGVVLLADARGTIWAGSAVMALGAPRRAGDDGEGAASPASVDGASPRLALPGRITWTLEIDRSLAPVLHLTHDGMLLPEPLVARFANGGLTVDAGAATLPASVLRLAGAPLNTLLPEGRCDLRWSGLRFDGGQPIGDGTLRIGSFALAISPVRPLGDYGVTWSTGPSGLAWRLTTEHGPLDLQGEGRSDGPRNHARVTVRVAADAPVAVAAQLRPLLDLLGRRGTDQAVVETGGRT